MKGYIRQIRMLFNSTKDQWLQMNCACIPFSHSTLTAYVYGGLLIDQVGGRGVHLSLAATANKWEYFCEYILILSISLLFNSKKMQLSSPPKPDTRENR